MDLCETPGDFFEGIDINMKDIPNQDYWKIKVAIAKYKKPQNFLYCLFLN